MAVVLGGTGGGQNWKRIFEKTRVGFGRTEVSLPFFCTAVCALSSGHGPRGRGFREFRIVSTGGFLGVVLGGTGGVKIGTVFLKKLGSDLVVQSSR